MKWPFTNMGKIVNGVYLEQEWGGGWWLLCDVINSALDILRDYSFNIPNES